jgi:hypothetical protein
VIAGAALALAAVGALAGWLAPGSLAPGLGLRRRLAVGAAGGAVGGLALWIAAPAPLATAGAIGGALGALWLARRYPAGPR